MNHELKTWPEFFDAVASGAKTFEVRRDDRGFQVGDRLVLLRWQPSDRGYQGGGYVNATGDDVGFHSCARITARITYKLPGGRFGIDPTFCVLGFKREDAPDGS